MPNYQQGHYSSPNPLPSSISPVATAIPAFIGYTEKASLDGGDDLHLVPTRITSLLEYHRVFGYAAAEKRFRVEVNTSNGTSISVNHAKPSNYLLYYALQAYFSNGGGPCYIISVGTYTDKGEIVPKALLNGLKASTKEDEISLIVFPEGTRVASADDYYRLLSKALEQSHELQDRFLICDVYLHQNAAVDDVDEFRNNITGTTVQLSFGAAYYPYLEMSLDYHYHPAEVEVILDGTKLSLEELEKSEMGLYLAIKTEISTLPVILPPAAAIAGAYANVDEHRGVWKAPANVNIHSVIRLTISISNDEQERLNIDAQTGKSINAIRAFPGRGPAIIWGARTLAGNDNEWRYVPVRRFFNMVEESIKKALQQFVFEPNDANTWGKVKRLITDFLNQQWRSGALIGATPEESFFVKVGLGETMTANDLLEGRMIVEIGMAMIRPGEFTMIKLSQKMPAT